MILMLLGEALYNCHPSCKEAFARLRASQPCGQGGKHRRQCSILGLIGSGRTNVQWQADDGEQG